MLSTAKYHILNLPSILFLESGKPENQSRSLSANFLIVLSPLVPTVL